MIPSADYHLFLPFWDSIIYRIDWNSGDEEFIEHLFEWTDFDSVLESDASYAVVGLALDDFILVQDDERVSFPGDDIERLQQRDDIRTSLPCYIDSGSVCHESGCISRSRAFGRCVEKTRAVNSAECPLGTETLIYWSFWFIVFKKLRYSAWDVSTPDIWESEGAA